MTGDAEPRQGPYVLRGHWIHDEDWALSRALARPSRQPVKGLRSLVVNRFSHTLKLALRRGLRSDALGAHCEACGWTREPVLDGPVPAEWRCSGCRRLFRVEMVVYEQVVDEPGPRVRQDLDED